MTARRPARTTAGRTPRKLVAGLVVVIAALGADLGDELLASSPPKATPADGGRAGDEAPGRQEDGALGVADGAVPDGTTAFDDEIPGVGKLDPALLSAVRQATSDAARQGLDLVVESGWRSRTYQEHLLDEAISEYGSREEAARWVATPETSAHVAGDAVDIGPSEGAAWLSEHGARYGLCQTYENEPWHFELRPSAVTYGCPARYADPTHDPRMQQ